MTVNELLFCCLFFGIASFLIGFLLVLIRTSYPRFKKSLTKKYSIQKDYPVKAVKTIRPAPENKHLSSSVDASTAADEFGE